MATGLFDDLILSEESKRTGLSKEALRDLAKLERPSKIEVGTPVAITLFWHEVTCQRCFRVYLGPRYHAGPMIKRQFSNRIEYQPAQDLSSELYQNLPREVNLSTSKISFCKECFTNA